MKTVLRLSLAMASVLLSLAASRADTAYVWCTDGTIHRFDTNGNNFVFPGSFFGFYVPAGLAVNASGSLHVVSGGNVDIFTRDGIPLNFPPQDSALLDIVSGLGFDSADQLFCTSPWFFEVFRPVLGGDGNYRVPPYGQYTQSHLAYPLSISFNASNQMFIVNGANGTPFTLTQPEYTNTIQKFDTNFTFLGTVATGLHGAWGSAVDKDGNLYVSTTDDDSIHRFATNGSVEVVSDYFDDWLYQPKGIAFDSFGNLFVANSGNGTVVKFAPNGTSTVIASNLVSPTSIAIYPGLKLWRVPIRLANQTVLTNGAFQFSFATNPYGTNTVLAATNPAGPWNPIGTAVEVSPGDYQFTDTQATNSVLRFYRVRSE